MSVGAGWSQARYQQFAGDSIIRRWNLAVGLVLAKAICLPSSAGATKLGRKSSSPFSREFGKPMEWLLTGEE
jgi:hypothetical protein